MTDDQLRPGQVAKITAAPPLPAQLADDILDSTEAELAAAAAQLADDTREWLERVGRSSRPAASSTSVMTSWWSSAPSTAW